jgi:hypothetical protein
MPELNDIPSRLPFAKSTAKGSPFSMRGVPAIAANPREGSRLLRFWVKAPNTSSEIGTTLSRARACGRRVTALTLSAVAGPPRIVDRVPYVQALEEPKRVAHQTGRWSRLPSANWTPKTLRRMPELNVIPSRLPFAKSTAKGPPFSMRGVAAQDYSGFGLKFQTPARKFGTTLSRACACGRMETG